MGKAFSTILTDRSMMVNGMKIFVKAMEYIRIQTVIPTKVNGKIIKDMAKERIPTLQQVCVISKVF